MPMAGSICGLDCGQCAWREQCRGCEATCGRPFGEGCIAARCCARRGLARCAECSERCALKRRAIDEFNALGIPDMPEVTDLNLLKGSVVNIEYTLPGGQHVKFWRDDEIYLGNQLERLNSDRCYGIVASDNYLLVCEYDASGADARIVAFKRRVNAQG